MTRTLWTWLPKKKQWFYAFTNQFGNRAIGGPFQCTGRNDYAILALDTDGNERIFQYTYVRTDPDNGCGQRIDFHFEHYRRT